MRRYKRSGSMKTNFPLKIILKVKRDVLKRDIAQIAKTQDRFVALVPAAFSFLRVAEALNGGKKDLFVKTLVFC